MAWGYWSATTVSDRARSPRRGTAPAHSHLPSSMPAPVSNNPESPEEEDYQAAPLQLSRRPSLVNIEFTGPLEAPLQPMCSHFGGPAIRDFPIPPDLPLEFPPGFSRDVLNPSPPMFGHKHEHGCFYHQTAAHVHHHQCLVHDVGASEDEDGEPGYATGKLHLYFSSFTQQEGLRSQRKRRKGGVSVKAACEPTLNFSSTLRFFARDLIILASYWFTGLTMGLKTDFGRKCGLIV